MRRAALEQRLEAVPRPLAPRPGLEQVRTPPAVAAQFLWTAWEHGAIEGRRVLDLGCGTGILSWGAALLGASAVLGVEIDAGDVEVARSLRLADPPPGFLEADVATWRPTDVWETVVMNPPFGAQRANRNADRAFYQCAAETPGRRSAWFLAQPKGAPFLQRTARELGARIEQVGQWRYPLEAYYAHHREPARILEVAGFRMSW